MDLDEIKGRIKSITAPNIESEQFESPVHSIDDFIRILKDTDEAERRRLKKATPFWFAAAFAFIALFASTWLSGNHADFTTVIFRGLLALFYCLFGGYLILQRRKLSAVDYTEPIVLFIDKAEKRYRFVPPPYTFYVFLLLLLFILMYSSYFYIRYALRRYIELTDDTTVIIVTCLFYLIVLVFGYVASFKDWKKKKAPLRQEIIKMISELKKTENNNSM
jgi:hypothetical protein